MAIEPMTKRTSAPRQRHDVHVPVDLAVSCSVLHDEMLFSRRLKCFSNTDAETREIAK